MAQRAEGPLELSPRSSPLPRVTPGREEGGEQVPQQRTGCGVVCDSDLNERYLATPGTAVRGGGYTASMEWRGPAILHGHDHTEEDRHRESEAIPVFGFIDSFAARSCPSLNRLLLYVNDLPGTFVCCISILWAGSEVGSISI